MDAGTTLAADRTRLAYERTQMAWVRTATSLISFGFTIYKFFQIEMAKEMAAHPVTAPIGPREFALIMIGTGLVALLLSTLEHMASLRRLRITYGPMPRSVAAIVGGLVSLLGIAAFLAVAFRQ
jgi:putative membrane protein